MGADEPRATEQVDPQPTADAGEIVDREDPGALPDPTHSVQAYEIEYQGKKAELPFCCFCEKPWTHGPALRLHTDEEAIEQARARGRAEGLERAAEMVRGLSSLPSFRLGYNDCDDIAAEIEAEMGKE